MHPALPADFPPLKTPEPLDGRYQTVLDAITDGELVPFLGGDASE